MSGPQKCRPARGGGTRAVCLVLLLLTTGITAALENQLGDHHSPYLAMHAGDPVRWQRWDAQALALAREQNKLVYLSIGYFSCHWCHVMQRESYQDSAVAAALNQDFIPIKVDRELQPALDEAMIGFVERTRGQAGWPLNVFLTPEGYPVFGLTYAPPQAFHGLLERLSTRWQADHAQLSETARNAIKAWHDDARPAPRYRGPVPVAMLRTALVEQALAIGDELSGGFGNQSKFPSVPQLQALLAAQTVAPNDNLRDLLELTLRQMATQGLRDHLGGGFFRYTVDPAWQTPHFEKMLYDNALLAELYLVAAVALERPALAAVAFDTLDFMLRELADGRGALIASLSAVDEQGTEGGYYLWRPEALDQLLSPAERTVVGIAWNLIGTPRLEAGLLPVQVAGVPAIAQASGLPEQRIQSLLASARNKLLTARAKRTLPRDTKILAGWNGLALSALTRAAGTDSPAAHRYRDAGRALHRMLTSELWDGERLLRNRPASAAAVAAQLEDYAFVARGLTDWARLTGAVDDLAVAVAVTRQAWSRFYSSHGWRLAERMLIPLNIAEAVVTDGPLPSPSAVVAAVSAELATRIKDANLRDNAADALRLRSDDLERTPYLFASHIAALVARAKMLETVPPEGSDE